MPYHVYRTPAVDDGHRRLPVLAKLTTRASCRERWSNMDGDERVRRCGSCAQNVYDLAAMGTVEAERFLAEHLEDDVGDEACGRVARAPETAVLYRRPDGRVLTGECPKGARRRHRWRVAVATAFAVGALLAGGAAAANRKTPPPKVPRHSRVEVPRAPVRERSAGGDPLLEFGVPPPEPAIFRDDVTFDGWRWLPADAPPQLPGLKLRVGDVAVSDGLPPEIVSRIVRQSFGRFRWCHERLVSKFEGTVVTKFAIGPDGSVLPGTAAATATPVTPKDDRLVHCIGDVFQSLSFPAPERGVRVDVLFPVRFYTAAR